MASKQFCKHGHDTFVCGRNSEGKCFSCCRIRGRNRYLKNKALWNRHSHEYYHRNKHEILRNKHVAVTAIRSWVDDLKIKAGCVDCGYDKYPEALDFDHIDHTNKVNAISQMILGLKPKDDILAEIQKCVVVCSNCHRHRTKERGYIGCGINRNAIEYSK